MSEQVPPPAVTGDGAVTGGLANVLDKVSEVGGWMTDGQAELLWRSARILDPGASVVEIGSFQGRSTIVLASAVPDGCTVVAIDPHAGNDRGPNEIEGFEEEAEGDNAVFNRNLTEAGVADRVRHVRKFSDDAHADVAGGIDLLYIDGAHRFGPANADIRSWGDRVNEGGTMLIHDSFNAVGVTLAQLVSLLLSPRFRYVGRSESMAEYRCGRLGLGARLASAGRQLAQMPYFAWCQLVKVLIKLGLAKVTTWIGNPTGQWPY